MTVRAKHLNNLVDVHLLHVLASRLEILTGIEVVRMLSEVLTDGSSHCQTRVRVDVDLADSALGSLAELLLGDTDGVGESTTILVDGGYLVLRYRRRTVEHDGESGELLLDFGEDVECEGRRNEESGLGILGALCGSELVSTVARTDRNSEAVATGAGSKLNHLSWLGVVRLCCRNLVFNSGEDAELSLYGERSQRPSS